ncbi:MAG: EAL domain-containing protein [Thiobacillus sp.]|nr:EAL domain-containing protein [Thiobacillus sp.]
MAGPGRFVFIAGLTALAYWLAAFLSLKFSTYVAGVAAAVWLAAGIAAFASLRFGAAGVLGVLLGSFAANSLILPPGLALVIGCGAALGAALMAYLVRHLSPFSAALDYVDSVAKFALVLAPLGAAVSAVVGTAALYGFGILPFEQIGRAFWVWWLGDILGIYLVAPLLLTASRWDLLPATRRARIEGLALMLAMLLLTRLLLQYEVPMRPAEIVLFVMLPGVLWAALRFSITGASLAIFLAASIVLGMALVSYGGINPTTSPQDVFALQISMIVMALGGLFVASALTERRYSEMRLDMLANHDPLTGLPNRSYFQDFLSHTLARAQREQMQVSLLFIDLDRFKQINDTQGHEVGDQVLRIVAGRLDEQLRADDFVARLGGDEFAVVLTHPATSRAASRVANKLIRALSESFKINQRRYAIGASIGISVYPDDAADANTLLRQADLAMYQAKQRRSGFEYYSGEMNTRAQQQLMLENGLRQALDRRELALVFQPKVDLGSGRVVGLEALIRWMSRSGSLIGPRRFIPVAEETGLIVPIGRWAIRAACEQWVAWRDAGLDPPPVAVNLSPRQFGDERLAEDIDAIVLETGMDTAYLEVEITESAAMDNPERTFAMLDALRQRGLHVYIDDFGTGYSNLGQLKRMPIDALKIDKSLIDDVLLEGDAAEIATAVIRLAHTLNMRVVAEGVETPEQMAFLKARDCDEIQGFVVARPMPPEKISALFTQTFPAG